MKFEAIKLGIAPIAWSNDDMPEMGADISFEQCITEMAAAGYQGCEVGHKFPRDPKVLQAALAPHRLCVSSAWYSLYFTEDREQETLTGFITHMNFLKAMGAKVIVVCECGHSVHTQPLPVFAAKPDFTRAQWQALQHGLNKIVELAKANAMQVVFHPHMGTGVQQAEEIDRLMEQSEVSLLLDTGHLHFAGCDPLRTLQKHGKRIQHIHLKDIRPAILARVRAESLSFLEAVKAGVFTVPGDGCINFAAVFKLLHEQQYQGWWIVEAEQDPRLANPLTYAIKARTFIGEFFTSCDK